MSKSMPLYMFIKYKLNFQVKINEDYIFFLIKYNPVIYHVFQSLQKLSRTKTYKFNNKKQKKKVATSGKVK